MSEQPTILVVDDEATLRAILFEDLTKKGYRVLLAEDGESALEIVDLTRPNVILLDIMLPGIDGYEVCRQVRKRTAHRETPILFMSGLDDGPTRSAIYKVGGNNHLLKPPVPIEVTTLIEQHLTTQHYRSELSQSATHTHRRFKEISHYVDYVAHDMKNPLLGILGFADELVEEFKNSNVPIEWAEFATLIRKSSIIVDKQLDALVLLKNLTEQTNPEITRTNLQDITRGAISRFEDSVDGDRCDVASHLSVDGIRTDPILLEELILVILRIIDQLNPEPGEFTVSIKCESIDDQSAALTFEADTRTIEDQELVYLLEPITAEGRKKVKGTEIFPVCAQKIIESLNLQTNLVSSDRGVCIKIHLPT